MSEHNGDGRPFRIVARIELPRLDAETISAALKIMPGRLGMQAMHLYEWKPVAALVTEALDRPPADDGLVRFSLTMRDLAWVATALIATTIDRGWPIHDEMLRQINTQYPAAQGDAYNFANY